MKDITKHCLYNWVGIEHCGLPESGSGNYINDLPGMYTEMAQKIATGEEITFKNIFDKVQKRSFTRLEEDLVSMLSNEVKFNEIICQTYRLQPQYNQLNIIPASNEYRGIYIQLPQSKYSVLELETLYIFNAGSAVTTTLKAFDLNDGSELITEEIELEEGLNQIAIDFILPLRYKIFQAFIGVDCSNVDTIKTESYYYGWFDDCDCIYTSNYSYREGHFMLNSATLPIGSGTLYENVNRSSVGSGVTFKANVSCSANQFICENKKRFTSSLQYLEASEMLKQKIGSPKVNFFTISNLEGTALLKDEFESEYKQALNRAIQAIPLHGEGECFNCEPKMEVVYGGNMP